ncbi:MAG: TrwB [Azospira oryzae]|nr:MAG: TrwB [Azospira oryzae]PZP80858.1 MAG: TrwB [Azospira oryzae]
MFFFDLFSIVFKVLSFPFLSPARALTSMLSGERPSLKQLGAAALGLLILSWLFYMALSGRGLEAIATYSIPSIFLFIFFSKLSSFFSLFRGAGGDGVVRGAEVTASRPGFFRRRHSGLEICKVSVPPEIEPLHFLVSGSTGTGKSQVINRMLLTLRDRGDRCIIVDSGGEAMARLWRNGDVLLNPLDARSVAWSPFSEMDSPFDADRLAKSAIPDREGPDADWALYSQALVAAVLQRLHERGEADNSRLLHYLTIAKSQEIEELVSGLPAQTLFDTGAAKMLSSVRGIVGSYLPSYRYLPPEAGPEAFSVRKWIAKGSGWLWLPYLDSQLASIRSLVSCWIAEAVNATLSLRPDPDRKLWLILDEAASLGRVQALADGLTKGRKFGLRAVLGLQSVSQLRETYGRDGSQTLLSCLSTQLFLRAADAESAEYASRSLGEQEIVRPERSVGDTSSNVSYRHATQRAVLASEIAGLPNRKGYLKLASEPNRIRLVEIQIVSLGPELVPPFDQRRQK